MINPIAGNYLADALRDERRPQPLPRYRKARSPLRARLLRALGPRESKAAPPSESEVLS